MPDWFANHFLHPGYAWSWAAAALVAAPIIIHFINRLRYRRVRFAAMEFLLASQRRNRRRVLIEQLLLLLLRVAAILLVILLIGRFTSDGTVLDLFQETRAHHLILLDDSGSMRDREGDQSVFDRAKTVCRRLAEEGARQQGSQRFTLLLLSRPDQSVAGLSERLIDQPMLADLATYLDDLDCTVRRLKLTDGLVAAAARLKQDHSASRFLHVLSDFREIDWLQDQSVIAATRELDAAGVQVNLVRGVAEPHENLAVTDLSGEIQAAAEGVPLSLQVKVANRGTRDARDVRLTLSADGNRLPMTVEFDNIPAGQEAAQNFYTVFEQADRHSLEVALPADALDQDNVRHLALDVPAHIPVLVIDATPDRMQGQYVVDAIADAAGSNRVLTGVSAILETPDYLRKFPLDGFQSIVLINVPQLPEDGVVALEKYVAKGGGLAWFLGNLVQPEFYNERLFQNGTGLFPVRLAPTFTRLSHAGVPPGTGDVIPADHPLLRVLTYSESVLLRYVTVNAWHPVDPAWWDAGNEHPPSLELIASLRDRSPLIFEHTWGPRHAHIATFLTAAGPLMLPPEGSQSALMWNNWASDENAAISFLVLQLELQKLIARPDRMPPLQTVGEPIIRTFSPSDYRSEVDITTPDNRSLQIQAAPLQPAAEGAATTGEPAATPQLQMIFRDTDDPGVYAVRMMRQDGTPETTLVACNVPPEESRLALATDANLRAQLGETKHLEIREAGSEDWLAVSAPGNESRIPLIAALLALLVVEQFLAYRFSYHPRRGEAA